MGKNTTILLNLFIAVSLICAVPTVYGEEYDGLKDVKSAKIVFDERESNPKVAALHLNLIHKTYKDLAEMKKDPAFVVVFMGPSVNLINKNREGFSDEDRKSLDEIARTITAMSKDGIKTEICLAAANFFNVDPESVLPEIKRVGNGWISMTVHQAQGYSLVPVY